MDVEELSCRVQRADTHDPMLPHYLFLIKYECEHASTAEERAVWETLYRRTRQKLEPILIHTTNIQP